MVEFDFTSYIEDKDETKDAQFPTLRQFGGPAVPICEDSGEQPTQAQSIYSFGALLRVTGEHLGVPGLS